MASDIVIVTPVYEDWPSFQTLIRQIGGVAEGTGVALRIVAVNDGIHGPDEDPRPVGGHIRGVEVVHLHRNLGHQKAIAIGLAYVSEHRPCDAVVVMDSDGEDRPDDVMRLIRAVSESSEAIVFARRSKRSEGIWFRLGYQLYKVTYRVLTGSHISYGNFSIVPAWALERLVFASEIWNHYSAGTIRSRIPIRTIPTVRGRRIDGRSKMNLASLTLHGLSAVSVHMDGVAVRMVLAAIALVVLATLGLVAVVGIRVFTELAIPGWATNASIGFVIIIMQALLISVLLAFVTLTYRTQKLFIPRRDYQDHIAQVVTLLPRAQ